MRVLIVINIAVGKRLASNDKTHHKMFTKFRINQHEHEPDIYSETSSRKTNKNSSNLLVPFSIKTSKLNLFFPFCPFALIRKWSFSPSFFGELLEKKEKFFFSTIKVNLLFAISFWTRDTFVRSFAKARRNRPLQWESQP